MEIGFRGRIIEKNENLNIHECLKMTQLLTEGEGRDFRHECFQPQDIQQANEMLMAPLEMVNAGDAPKKLEYQEKEKKIDDICEFVSSYNDEPSQNFEKWLDKQSDKVICTAIKGLQRIAEKTTNGLDLNSLNRVLEVGQLLNKEECIEVARYLIAFTGAEINEDTIGRFEWSSKKEANDLLKIMMRAATDKVKYSSKEYNVNYDKDRDYVLQLDGYGVELSNQAQNLLNSNPYAACAVYHGCLKDRFLRGQIDILDELALEDAFYREIENARKVDASLVNGYCPGMTVWYYELLGKAEIDDQNPIYKSEIEAYDKLFLYPRGIELQVKEHFNWEMTEEAKIELDAYYQFPNYPAGAELYIKMALYGLNPTELIMYNQISEAQKKLQGVKKKQS